MHEVFVLAMVLYRDEILRNGVVRLPADRLDIHILHALDSLQKVQSTPIGIGVRRAPPKQRIILLVKRPLARIENPRDGDSLIEILAGEVTLDFGHSPPHLVVGSDAGLGPAVVAKVGHQPGVVVVALAGVGPDGQLRVDGGVVEVEDEFDVRDCLPVVGEGQDGAVEGGESGVDAGEMSVGLHRVYHV